MRMTIRSLQVVLAAVGVTAAVTQLPAAAPPLPTSTPEEVGLSSTRLTRINDMMQRRIDRGDISGGVTIVARRGRIAHFEAHGTTDIEAETPTTKNSVFRIASMTKVVTGVAVMMMVEEGKLRITDPVSKFIPEFTRMNVAVEHPAKDPQAGGDDEEPSFYTVPATRDITVRDLLTHTSGLVSGPMSSASALPVARKPEETLADYIPRLGQTALEFQPGSRWSYSGLAGFDTLGYIVEIVSGMPYDQFLHQRIFEPLEMRETAFYPTDELAPRLVTAYQPTANGVVVHPNPQRFQSRQYFMGAAGLVSTAKDYLRFAQMLLNGGDLGDQQLLSPRTVDQMASVHVPDTLPGRSVGEGYGLSVRVLSNAVRGGSRLSDGSYGWSGAYGTHFWVDPTEDLVAIMMIQTRIPEMRPEFENAVMQAIIE